MDEDSLNIYSEGYSPNIEKFFLINPFMVHRKEVIEPNKFKIFIRNGATNKWSTVPDEEEFSNNGEILSTFENLTEYFPGFRCIDDGMNRKYKGIFDVYFNELVGNE